MQWKQRFSLGILLALSSIAATQARPGAEQAHMQIEASMNVAGELTLTPDGTVTAVKLADEASLPPAVRERIKHSVASWRFDPVRDNGSALPAQLPMSLLLVAKQGEGENYLVSIRSAHFWRPGAGRDECAHQRHAAAALPRSGVSGRCHRRGLSDAQDRARRQGPGSDRRASEPDIPRAGIQTCTVAPGVCRCGLDEGACMDVSAADRGSGRQGAVLGHACSGQLRHRNVATRSDRRTTGPEMAFVSAWPPSGRPMG